MRLQPRPDRDDDRDADRGRYNQGGDCGRSLQGCSTMAHPFAHRQACCPPRSVCRLCQIFLAHDGDDQSEIVEEGLPVDAGMEKADLAAEEAALPRRPEQIEQGAVLRRHMRPERLERRNVHVAPVLEAAAREHVKPSDAVAQPGIGADDIFAVHAVAHLRNLVVIDLAAGATDQEIRPPVVRRNFGGAAADHQQPARGFVEHDGVAAGDTLHQRIVKARLAAVGARVAERAAVVVDQHGARAIHRWDMRRPRSTGARPRAQAWRAPRRRPGRNRHNSRTTAKDRKRG